jgi:hypothetical protein
MENDREDHGKAKRQPTGSYGVGYCRPPEATRFPKGRSGNPRGRPKDSKNVATYLDEILQERISVRVGGKTKTMTKVEAVLHSIILKAMNGDPKALSSIIALARAIGLLEPVANKQAGPSGVLLVEIPADRSPEGLRRLEEEIARQQDELQARVKRYVNT